MPKRYKIVKPIGEEDVELTNVNLTEKPGLKHKNIPARGIITADQLAKPLEISNPKNTGKLPKSIPNEGLVLEESEDGTKTLYNLTHLHDPELRPEDMDTYTSETEKITLTNIKRYLTPGSTYTFQLNIKGLDYDEKSLKKIRQSISGDCWEQIIHNVAMLGEKEKQEFQKHLTRMMHPIGEFSPNFRRQLIETIDGVTVSRIGATLAISDEIKKDGEFPEFPKPLLEEKPLMKAFKKLNSRWAKKRLEGSRDVFSHYSVLRYFGKPSISYGLPVLMKAVDDPDERIRCNVVDTLGFTRAYSATDKLTSIYFNDPSHEVRGETLTALAMIGDPGSFNTLASGIRDPHPEVQSKAAEAIGYVIQNQDDRVILGRWEDMIIDKLNGAQISQGTKSLITKHLECATQKKKETGD